MARPGRRKARKSYTASATATPAGPPNSGEVHISAAQIAETISALLQDLVEARDHFDAPPGQGRMAGAGEILALTAVLKFCQALPGAQENGILRPLEAALRTYLGLSGGHQPTLNPTPWLGGRAGGGPPSMREVKFIGALAMSRFMDAGLGREEAARRVAGKLDAAGYRQHGPANNPIDSKTVARWRDKMRDVTSDDKYLRPWREEFDRFSAAFRALGKPSISEVETWTRAAIVSAAPEIRK